MAEHWRGRDGVVHLIGIHKNGERGRIVYGECLEELGMVLGMLGGFAVGNTKDAPTCIGCIASPSSYY